MIYFRALIVIFLFLTSSVELRACIVDNAKYVSEDGKFLAGFRPLDNHKGWVSDLSFYIKSNASGDTYWFLFDEGASINITLISTDKVPHAGWTPPDPETDKRPLGSAQYLAANSHDKFYDGIMPMKGGHAPERILVPDLPVLIELATGNIEHAKHSFFALKSCS